jgi:serine/threonine protein kinase
MHAAGDIVTLTAGAWRLRTPLAASSYGVLWRADDVVTGQPAAIKLVNHEQMCRAPAALQRHWRDGADAEIALLRSLHPWDHRHIVRLLDAGIHLGHPALALELLDGDLAAHLAAHGRRAGRWTIPYAQALDWTAQVHAALARVHQAGWRHLDLKPANLLIDAAANTLKLADFGTSRPLADGVHPYAGTPGWQAPEQRMPAPAAESDAGAGARYQTDARSDYFALGMLLYYLVTGERLGYGGAGAVPASAATVLAPDETARFRRHAGTGGGDGAALGLLRALLAPCPDARPRHALDISRLLARARAASAAPNLHALRSAA